jgi:UPF0716 family protein affecting phage T7 exclusion
MKAVPALIGLIVWMLLTLVLAFSVIGLILFIPKDTYTSQDNTPSTWMTIGRALLNKVTQD